MFSVYTPKMNKQKSVFFARCLMIARFCMMFFFRMPLLLSNKSCDLNQLKGKNENSSEFCTKYYLANGDFPNRDSEKHADDKHLFRQSKFQQSVDIDRLKTYPKIVFLGTVSASASLERNHTSILIDTA